MRPIYALVGQNSLSKLNEICETMKFETLKQIYDNSISRFGQRPSFSMFERESLTYNDLADRVDYVREMLLGAGVGGGDKVVLLSGNMPTWPVCYFACVTAGIVVVPVLPDFSGEELDKIIAHSEAKALMVSDKLYAKLSAATLKRMNIVLRTKNLGVISRRSKSLAKAIEPKPDDLAAIIYTSGTTSSPKGVMLSHSALATQVQMYPEFFPIYPDDVFLSLLPLSHTYECSIGMLYPFSAGASVVYMDRPPTASALMPAFRAVRPTIILSVPLIIEKIYRSQVLARFTRTRFLAALYSTGIIRRALHGIAGVALKKLFGGRVRFFGIGGAKLDRSAEQFMRDAHFPYAIGYGLTETAPLLFGAAPSKTRLQSGGYALSGIEYRLEDVNASTGEGELVVKTPCIMKGYYKNPEATAEAFTADGWFHTKDLCTISSDGYMTVHGRANNMIIGASGENIYPEEIESVINTHRLVTESIVVADHGTLVALVELDKDKIEQSLRDFHGNVSARMEEITRDIREYVNSRVSKFSRVSVVVEQPGGFEKTPTHKIKRFLYKRQ